MVEPTFGTLQKFKKIQGRSSRIFVAEKRSFGSSIHKRLDGKVLNDVFLAPKKKLGINFRRFVAVTFRV